MQYGSTDSQHGGARVVGYPGYGGAAGRCVTVWYPVVWVRVTSHTGPITQIWEKQREPQKIMNFQEFSENHEFPRILRKSQKFSELSKNLRNSQSCQRISELSESGRSVSESGRSVSESGRSVPGCVTVYPDVSQCYRMCHSVTGFDSFVSF